MGCVGVDWIKSVFALHFMPSTTVVRIEGLLSLSIFSATAGNMYAILH
jgi:hypothetical protein